METIRNHGESEHLPTEICAPPVCEILQDASLAREIWPTEAEQICPQIEQHRKNALAISNYLDRLAMHTETPETKTEYYDAASKILETPELQRFALFLPFESLPYANETSGSANNFREKYLSAWCDLLYSQDVRANFLDGDIVEPDARTSEPERVVKAAHLAPWLIKHELTEADEIIDLVARIDDDTLTRSLLDTRPLLKDWNLLTAQDETQLQKLAAKLPPRPEPPTPKYISPKRELWLAQKAQGIIRPNSQIRDLAQPFSARKNTLQSEITYAKNLAAQLNPETTYGVICLGGSRIKGYSQPDSDIDIWMPTKPQTKDNQLTLFIDNATIDSTVHDSIHTVPFDKIIQHLPQYATLLNTFWVGETENIKQLQQDLLPHYFQENSPTIRGFVTERLEQDLLEYRLMHKGYPSFYPDSNPEYNQYSTIDGSSAFYETDYRILSTKLFANYIFVPQVDA